MEAAMVANIPRVAGQKTRRLGLSPELMAFAIPLNNTGECHSQSRYLL